MCYWTSQCHCPGLNISNKILVRSHDDFQVSSGSKFWEISRLDPWSDPRTWCDQFKPFFFGSAASHTHTSEDGSQVLQLFCWPYKPLRVYPQMATLTIVCCFPVYVGCATVGAAAWWFMFYEDGPQLNYYQLVSHIFLYTCGMFMKLTRRWCKHWIHCWNTHVFSKLEHFELILYCCMCTREDTPILLYSRFLHQFSVWCLNVTLLCIQKEETFYCDQLLW